MSSSNFTISIFEADKNRLTTKIFQKTSEESIQDDFKRRLESRKKHLKHAAIKKR